MKVYVLMWNGGYEGKDLLAIYLKKADAEARLEEMRRVGDHHDRSRGNETDVEEWPVLEAHFPASGGPT